MEVITLAGGCGTRLAGVITARPKPMADIASRPFLEYLLDVLLKQGADTVEAELRRTRQTVYALDFRQLEDEVRETVAKPLLV